MPLPQSVLCSTWQGPFRVLPPPETFLTPVAYNRGGRLFLVSFPNIKTPLANTS